MCKLTNIEILLIRHNFVNKPKIFPQSFPDFITTVYNTNYWDNQAIKLASEKKLITSKYFSE